MKKISAVRIESPSNERIKKVASLRKSRNRRETGLIVVEGYNQIKRAIQNNILFREIYYCGELLGKEKLEELLDIFQRVDKDCFVAECSIKAFLRLTVIENPDGIIGVAERPYYNLRDFEKKNCNIVGVVVGIEKPGNLGAIVRTIKAAGAGALIVCDPKVDVFNPNVIWTSKGYIFSIPVIQSTSREAIEWLKGNDFKIFAAIPSAEKCFMDVNFVVPNIAIVTGAEHEGLSQEWIKEADHTVYIPMQEEVDSLNVSVCMAIIMYEAFRQRRKLSKEFNNNQ